MEWIAGFWVGALRHGGGYHLWELAQRVGGMQVLEEQGRDALLAAGVAAETAEAWAKAFPARTCGTAITMADPRYPRRMLALPEAPPVLCIEGNVDALSGPAWGVVGTRACTSYGASVARHLAGRLAASGATVVSGLARGIDAHAHRAALAVGRTVAVVGHGLDHTAPASHRRLRAEIVAHDGAIVSGFLDGTEPRPFRFPQRNAWIAGLSDGVVVVEAGRRSGASITARNAVDQGREVAVVPGPLGAEQSVGCLALLRDGARVVWDVEEFVHDVLGGAPMARDRWLTALFEGASLDDAARLARRPVAVLLAELSVLELEGVVDRLPGQRYAPGPRAHGEVAARSGPNGSPG